MTNNNNSQPIRQAQGEKGFAMPMLIAIVVLVIVGVGVAYFATRTEPSPTDTTQAPTGEETLPDGTVVKADGTMVKPDGTMVKPDGTIVKPDGTMVKPDGTMVKPDGTMVKPDGTMIAPDGTMIEKESGATTPPASATYTGARLAGTATLPLLDFNKADYDKAVASDNLVILYFYASWCPICRAEFPNMQTAFNELTGSGVVGFRVNYNDSDTDQSEKALASEFGVAYQHTKVFVKNGQRLLKSPEEWDEARYDMEIGKYR